MPIYEYRCRQCDNKFERLVKTIEDSVQECPKCQSTDVKKEFSTFGIGGCPNTGAKGHSKESSCSENVGGSCCSCCGQ
ncbi:FmdB family zinc ribbon protein [Paramaledivibacter caminithermalis]|jgi:putative FmdB family regulatory protein|uniref:Putative regulatory protein, FmdB family n=1 Tax=Paramaledivibacter caminithermalis (strain DSM 15212 / CIP 107654 / DViRD3) TaxID=1121301 RepID=A0A1M6LRR2_PARC5|nr:zinc ribbon domain-containing protein [Paramaledivibacter caminithermalis]SHJ73948.1 putative regulatory protein, FmdB family [Paramaledivibacter caminithermalis DSM 15212]